MKMMAELNRVSSVRMGTTIVALNIHHFFVHIWRDKRIFLCWIVVLMESQWQRLYLFFNYFFKFQTLYLRLFECAHWNQFPSTVLRLIKMDNNLHVIKISLLLNVWSCLNLDSRNIWLWQPAMIQHLRKKLLTDTMLMLYSVEFNILTHKNYNWC